MPPPHTRSAHALPRELIEAACQRDPSAWSEVVKQLSLNMTRELRLPNQLLRRLDDEDILQVAFLHAWERIESFEYRGEGSFVAWIHRILSNALRDDIRHHARGVRDTRREERRQLTRIAPEERGPDQQAALEEEIDRLIAAIKALPVLERRLVRMRLREGHSWREISDRTGRSPRSLRRALKGAVRHLASVVA